MHSHPARAGQGSIGEDGDPVSCQHLCLRWNISKTETLHYRIIENFCMCFTLCMYSHKLEEDDSIAGDISITTLDDSRALVISTGRWRRLRTRRFRRWACASLVNWRARGAHWKCPYSQELTILEDQEGSVNCKFGVIYAKADQNTDAQMLSNGNNWYWRTWCELTCLWSLLNTVKNCRTRWRIVRAVSEDSRTADRVAGMGQLQGRTGHDEWVILARMRCHDVVAASVENF